jgi:DNA invertase Pin-like site-specific DNA recombinase
MNARIRLVAYLRVSTDDQVKHGLGLPVQQKAINRWVKVHDDYRVVLSVRDAGTSGANGVETRAGLHEALRAVKAGRAHGLIALNLDRLARKLEIQEAILATVWAAGGRVFTVEDDGEVPEDDPDQPMRTALRKIRGVIAELERAMITKRMRDGRHLKQERGGYVGGNVPLGYRVEGHELVIDTEGGTTVERIRQLRTSGASLREIAATLTEEGHRTKRGGHWHPATVGLIMRRLDAAC